MINGRFSEGAVNAWSLFPGILGLIVMLANFLFCLGLSLMGVLIVDIWMR